MSAFHRLPQSVLVACLLCVPALPLAVAGPARAAEQAQPPQVPSPVDDFNKSIAEVKASLQQLTGRIEQSTRDIERLTAPDDARKQIAELQGLIAHTLGEVADNGDVARLGQKVIDYARAKQAQFEADTKFKPEERAFLQKEWKRIGDEARRATDDLANARSDFAGLLKTVQTRSDYIEELQALNNANQMLEVIHQLAGEIRAASGNLKTFIQTVNPPGPGT